MSWLFAIGMVMAAAASDPSVNVTVTLDPPEIPFHKQAQYTIAVEAPADVDVKLPDMVDKFGALPVSDVQRHTTPLKGNRRRIAETYVLDPIWAANYRIYAAQVTWGENEMTVPSPALRVRDLTDDEKKEASEFVDIAGPLTPHTPLTRDWRLWLVVAIVAAVAVATGVYLFVWRRREAQAPPPIPSWEVAYQRLRELDQRQLPQAEKHEPYYVDLSAILRYYIEDFFHLHAPEQTTQEFLTAASTSGALTPEHQRLLASFLRHCDLVKFAQYTPTLPEMERSFSTVLQFVDETAPKPEPPPDEKEAAA